MKVASPSLPAQPDARAERQRRGFLLVFANIGGAVVARSAGTLGIRKNMSCDHSVWFPYKQLSNAEAGALHLALCNGDTSGVQAHPAINAFYAELVEKHPQIDDVPDDQIDDHDFCPWSIAFDRSDGHMIMCCVWSKAEYIGGLLKSLAGKHGLALYDPQAEVVHYPGQASVESKPWWKLW